jgi:hypothetical protein
MDSSLLPTKDSTFVPGKHDRPKRARRHHSSRVTCEARQRQDQDTPPLCPKRECDSVDRQESPIHSPNAIVARQIRCLADEENQLLDELLIVSKVLYVPPPPPVLFEANASVSSKDATRILHIINDGYRRLIEMSKQLTAFAKLADEDQIALLKGVFSKPPALVLNGNYVFTVNIFGMGMIHSMFSFDTEKEIFRPTLFQNDTYIISLEELARVDSFTHQMAQR